MKRAAFLLIILMALACGGDGNKPGSNNGNAIAATPVLGNVTLYQENGVVVDSYNGVLIEGFSSDSGVWFTDTTTGNEFVARGFPGIIVECTGPCPR